MRQVPKQKEIEKIVKSATGLFLVLVAAFLVSPSYAQPSTPPGADAREPEVPTNIEVPVGNKVSFHVFAVGVQIYVWTGSAWMFQAPDAVLYDADGDVVGTHYAGPTWESNSGSKVVGQRVDGSTVDSTAIPWLLLRATTTQGPGILARTTYIQRVNTVGGLAPTSLGTAMGQEAGVPYTAEYFFYTAKV